MNASATSQIVTPTSNRYRGLLAIARYLAIALALAFVSSGPGGASLRAEVAAGGGSGFHIDADGALFAWGANQEGQLGDGTSANQSSPVSSAGGGFWRTVASSPFDLTGAGSSGHSLGIRADGTLWAWGRNDRGQLGTGDTAPRLEPVRISNKDDWKAVAAGLDFSVALNAEGRIFVWGDNTRGQLGNTTDADFSPTRLALGDKDGDTPINDTFVEIAAGAGHVLAVHGNGSAAGEGSLYVWGANDIGQLGLGHRNEVGGPVRVPGTRLWRGVEAGVQSSFAIDASTGRLFAWGSGPFGNLGTGEVLGTDIQQSDSPDSTINALVANMPYQQVAAAATHTLAVGLGGQNLFGTGQDLNGALGLPGNDTFATFQLIPLDLEDGVTIEDVAAGLDFSLVLLSDGGVLSVGRNDLGQLGKGTTSPADDFGPTALGAVDLIVDSINLISDPAALTAGGPIEFDIIVRNQGTGTVEAGTGGDIRIALSPQSVFGAEGQLDFADKLTVSLTDAIAPGSAASVRVTATLPAVVPTGDYRILVDLDVNDVLEEADESNNFGATGSSEGLLEFRADLEVDLIDASLPAGIQAGDSFDLEVDFINSGSGSLTGGAGSGFEYRLILSEEGDPLVGANFDLAIDETASEFPFESALPAGAAPERRTVRVTVPENVTLTDYFVGVIVDSTDQIEELDETNNTDFSASAGFTVSGLSIREALDLPEPPTDDAGTPDIDESVPAALDVSGGDASWFGKVEADAVDGDALSSPSLEAGQVASLTFEFDAPRQVTFRWKAQTSSSQNRLFFGANQVPLPPESQSAPEVLSGLRDWSEVSFIVPANTPVGFFYEQGVTGEADRVFVDDLRVSPVIELPDYFIEDIEFEAKSYMLQRDRLTVTVSGGNRGADFDLPDDFSVSVWLSRDSEAGDADDVLLGDLTAFQILNNGAEFVYRASFALPEILADADYFVLARVDSSEVTGNTTGSPAFNFGSVFEFNEAAPFSDTDNNFAFSENPGVRIIRAADLRVTRLTGDGELPIFVGGPADDPGFDPAAEQGEQTIFGTFFVEPLPGETSELLIRFDVTNEGLSPVEAQDFLVRIFVAPDRETAPENATTLFEFVESGGLAIGGGKTFEVTTSIPEEVDPGRFYYVGVQVDAMDEVPENDELDNITRSEDNNVFVGEVPLEIALNDSLNDPSLREWKDGFPGTLEGSLSNSPWFGQRETVQLDSATSAAAQSGPVPIGGRSVMQTEMTIEDNDRLISFFWKVSSQLDPTTGQADTLTFEVSKNGEDFEVIAGPIAGEVDWTRVEHVLSPGNYRLRWTYEETGDGVRGGADAGWVDNFSALAPDFEPVNLEIIANDPVAPGDTVTVSFDLLNNGTGNFSSVLAQIRLVPVSGTVATLDWTTSDAGDVVLMPSTRVDLGSFTGDFIIPESLSQGEEFILGVWVDDQLAIPESNEGNNLKFLEEQKLSLVIPTSIDQALDTDTNPWVADGRAWQIGGNRPWFATQEAGADPDDFLTVPAMVEGESAILERIIEGPKILRFRWRENSAEGSNNRIFFEINGLSMRRDFDAKDSAGTNIDGFQAGSFFSIGSEDAGFVTESVLIPAGLQSVRFRYEVRDQDGSVDGAAAIDNMEIIDVPSGGVVGEADFAIRDVSFNPGGSGANNTQVYALERDRFPVEILAINRGADPLGLVPSDTEIEVRLSTDRNFEGDDVILGNLAPTQTLDGGRRLFYSGELDLPLNLEPGAYHLLLRVRALDAAFNEITLDGSELLVNNDFVSDFDSVEIIRLPQLVVRATEVENQKVFFPKEDIRFAWELENIGLGDIPAESGLTQTVELWAFPPGTTEFIFGNAEKILDVAEVVEDSALNGRLTAENALQSTIRYDQVFKLPSQARLLEALGIGDVDSDSEEISAEVLQNVGEMEGYEFFFVLQRDTSLEQSSNLAITALTTDRFLVSPFAHGGEPDPFLPTEIDYTLWRNFSNNRLSSVDGGIQGLILPSGELTDVFPGTGGDSGIPNFYYYAFNLPLVSDLSNAPFDLEATSEVVALRNNRIRNIAGIDRTEVSFPILRGATDVRYIVQKETAPGVWTGFYTITPPFLDQVFGLVGGFVGNSSLTEPDTGLLAEPEVVAVVDNNHSAIVTVRGDDDSPLRIVLQPTNLDPLPQFVIDQFAARGELDIRNQGPGDDFDGEGVSNIAELQFDADPTDASSGGSIGDLEALVAEEFAFEFGLFGSPAPTALGPFEDRDGDGSSNLAEMQLRTDPTDPAAGGDATALDVFVAEQFALEYNLVLPPNADELSPLADRDGDGISNIAEMQSGTDPNDVDSGGMIGELEVFVAEQFATEYGLFGNPVPSDLKPFEDRDGDGVSNIAEMQLGTDPINPVSGAALSEADAFVAEQFASVYGLFGNPVPAEIAAFEDRDGDGVSNLAEMQLGSNPTDADSGADIGELEAFVAEQFATKHDVIGNPAAGDLSPLGDHDGDGVSNLAEIQLGTDPTDPASGAGIEPQDAFVAEQFAFLGRFDPLPDRSGATQDFDFDGVSNVAELQRGFNPTDPDDAPANTLSPTASFIAERFAEQGVLNTAGDGIFAASLKKSSDFDGDGESNLLEIALGGDMALDSVTRVPIELDMDGTDFVITYVRLKTGLQPDGLSIFVECTADMSEAWEPVPDVGSTESLAADQSGLADDFERVELRVDTTQIDCNFFRIRVQDLLGI